MIRDFCLGVMAIGIYILTSAAALPQVEINDHSCPELPDEVRRLAYDHTRDVARLKWALHEAIVFWEACRLGDQSTR